MLAHPFMQAAFLAGIPIAALSGAVGYFMVLRSQVFTGDALSHVAFTQQGHPRRRRPHLRRDLPAPPPQPPAPARTPHATPRLVAHHR